jgi:hypothetical protein
VKQPGAVFYANTFFLRFLRFFAASPIAFFVLGSIANFGRFGTAKILQKTACIGTRI